MERLHQFGYFFFSMFFIVRTSIEENQKLTVNIFFIHDSLLGSFPVRSSSGQLLLLINYSFSSNFWYIFKYIDYNEPQSVPLIVTSIKRYKIEINYVINSRVAINYFELVKGYLIYSYLITMLIIWLEQKWYETFGFQRVKCLETYLNIGSFNTKV